MLPSCTSNTFGKCNGPDIALNEADKQGADHHLFTKRDNYVWNNDRGDCSALQKDGEAEKFDKCWYVAKQPEGIILHRVNGNFVVPTSSMATAGSRR